MKKVFLSCLLFISTINSSFGDPDHSLKSFWNDYSDLIVRGSIVVGTVTLGILFKKWAENKYLGGVPVGEDSEAVINAKKRRYSNVNSGIVATAYYFGSLEKSRLSGALFLWTTFKDASLKDSCIYKSKFLLTSWDNLKIGSCLIAKSVFKKSSFKNTHFSDLRIENCIFEGCDFDGAGFINSKIINSVFKNCSISDDLKVQLEAQGNSVYTESVSVEDTERI
ncbi:pentapeptide repeat-containing protein [Candidatus Babeliales bacterium]|nr:pentapeptide repeat-containing protein [Candidatus Babeliales bacterium]